MRVEILCAIPRRAGFDRLDFGCKVKHTVERGMEQRLLAESIARQQHATRVVIGDRERKHAVQPLDAGVTVFLVGVDDRFGVGMSLEPVAARLEIAPELEVVVDFPVEHNPDRPVFVGHRLLAAGAVDDGQPAVAEREPRCAMNSSAVRTAMKQPVRHGPDGVTHVWGQITFQTDYAADTAHAIYHCSKSAARAMAGRTAQPAGRSPEN